MESPAELRAEVLGGRVSANGVIGQWEPDELYRAEALMKQLEQHPGYKLLLQLIATEHKGVIRKLTAGPAPLEHTAYAYEGGRAYGLASMAAIVATIKDKARRVRRKLDEASPDDGEAH